jgi:hypothetical protein
LSTNVVEASLRAYLAAVNKLIAHHEAGVAAAERAIPVQRQPRAVSVDVPTSVPSPASAASAAGRDR